MERSARTKAGVDGRDNRGCDRGQVAAGRDPRVRAAAIIMFAAVTTMTGAAGMSGANAQLSLVPPAQEKSTIRPKASTPKAAPRKEAAKEPTAPAAKAKTPAKGAKPPTPEPTTPGDRLPPDDPNVD